MTDSKIKTLVVIPVYNHAAKIRAVVEKTLALGYSALVIDDGSDDQPFDQLTDLDVICLQHKENQGKGAAMLTAVAEAKKRGMTHIVGIDGDGQHDPADIDTVMPLVEDNPRAMILGARIFEDDVPGSSRFGRKFANFWYRVHTGSLLDDTQSGFRVYPLFIFDYLPLWTRRYAFDFEILVRMKQAGGEIIERPISVKYGVDRVTHIRLFVDNLRVSLLNTYFTIRRILFFIPHKKIPKETREPKKKWDSRGMGSPWQYTSFYVLIKLGGRPAAYALLYFVTLWYVLFSKKIRDSTRPYLKHRFPKGYGFFNMYQLVTEQGKALVDRAVVGILGDGSYKKRVDQLPQLRELVKDDKGLIILMSHVGNWKMSLIGLPKFGKTASAVLYRVDGDNDKHVFEHSGKESPFNIIDPTSDFGGTFQMMDCLKKNEILCLMGDRMMGESRQYCDIEFLGEKAKFPITAFKMAALTGTDILVLFSYKTAANEFDFDLKKVITLPQKSGMTVEEYQPYVQEYVTALEQFVQKHPYSYFNFYDVWA